MEMFEKKLNHVIKLVNDGKISHPAVIELLKLTVEYVNQTEMRISGLEMEVFGLAKECNEIQGEAIQCTEILRKLGFTEFLFMNGAELANSYCEALQEKCFGNVIN